jgi:signal transduction histidine kinase
MNLAPYIPLSGFIVNVLFAFFVFSRGPRIAANRVYLVLTLSIAVWNLGCYHLLIVPPNDPARALFWARFVFIGCIFGVVAFFHLAMIVAGFSLGRWMYWLYGFETLLAISDFTPMFIRDVQYLGSSGWYAVAGPMFYVFTVPFCLMFGSIFVLMRRRESLPPMRKRQLTPLVVGQAMLSILGANDLLPVMGIIYYPFTSVQVYPWGSLAAVFYGVITAYSVLQHQLLDIKVSLSRYAALLVRFIFLFSITLGLLLIGAAFTGEFTPRSFGASLIVFMIGALVAAVLFPRLFGSNVFEAFEHRLLGDAFEYQDRVRKFIETVPWQNDLSLLFDDLHTLFVGVFRFERYWVILRDETERSFAIARGFPDDARVPVPELKVPSPIFTYFEWGHQDYLALGTDYRRLQAGDLERGAVEQLSSFDAQFAFPLISDRVLYGLVLVGCKADVVPFTGTDLQLLVDLSKQLSLIVNQIRLKDEIMRAEELELLGRMSRGMAHDLNNLLTPIWTLLQLAHEGSAREALDEELIAVALRNVKMVRAYIKEALFFSENLRPDLQLGRLDLLVGQTVETLRRSKRKNVEIVTRTFGEATVEMDEILIQRMLANLISNAIDASPEGAEVRVEIEQLVKTEAARDWLRLRVIDLGVGIPRENLDRVLTPYFTTKNRGDEGRGFGLGLAISRKIVALHGGHLNISSQVRKGTTVQIDLPSRQLKPVIPEVASAA